MLKREITYEDFDGQTVTETFYFNLTKTEIVQLEVDYDGGLESTLRRIITTEDVKALMREFKKIVLMAYGVRSEDGKRFVKNDELREAFTQTAAYDALFIELATNDEAAAKFIQGIIPKDLAAEIVTQPTMDVQLPGMPPPVPPQGPRPPPRPPTAA
jgi:hypothetical protein